MQGLGGEVGMHALHLLQLGLVRATTVEVVRVRRLEDVKSPTTQRCDPSLRER